MIAAVSLFAAGAQTKKTSKKSKKQTTESKAELKFKNTQAQKKLTRDSAIYTLRLEDSLRLAGDSISDLQKDSIRLAYREYGMKYIDSVNKTRYAAIAQERTIQDKEDRRRFEISKAAKLNDYEARQVQLINETYDQRAKLISANAALSAEQKTQQLAALDKERKDKIRVVVGKSGVKKLDKSTKSFEKKNT